MELLYPYGGILLAPPVAAYLASVIARLRRRKDRRPGWGTGFLAILAGVLTTWICTFQFDAFNPWRWANAGGKVDLFSLLVATGFLAVVLSIMPAAYIVDRYQKSYDKTHPLG